MTGRIGGDGLLQWLSEMSLEDLLTHELAFNLDASPLQRAICRIAEGSPLGMLSADPTVLRGLGGTTSVPGRPRELAIVAGVRTGKSLIAGCMAVHAALHCDVGQLGPGETPRVACVSTKMDNATVVLDHIKGRVQASTLLRPLIIGEPTADTIVLRHPTGRPVEICVVAGSRAGASLVSRWMAGVIFDEYAKMLHDGDDGVVNWQDCRRAVLERILPGGYLAHITSPWAPFGPAYTHVQEHWGKPTKELVVIRARGDEMNPSWWTPERCEAAKAEPEVYRTDVLAEFSSPEESLFHADHVEAAVRREPDVLPRESGAVYTAAMDPATRGNGWTFVVVSRSGDKRRVALAREWIGSTAEPLSPAVVLSAIASICREYGVEHVESDQWSGDALRDLAQTVGLSINTWTLTDRQRTEKYLALRTMFALGQVEIPPEPHLRADLVRVKKRVTNSGASIVLPQTSDGRHADFAPTLMLAMSRFLDDVAPVPVACDEETVRMRESVMRRYGARGDDD